MVFMGTGFGLWVGIRGCKLTRVFFGLRDWDFVGLPGSMHPYVVYTSALNSNRFPIPIYIYIDIDGHT